MFHMFKYIRFYLLLAFLFLTHNLNNHNRLLCDDQLKFESSDHYESRSDYNFHYCPSCDFSNEASHKNAKEQINLHKLFDCFQFNYTHASHVRNQELPSYKCKCKYYDGNECESVTSFSSAYSNNHCLVAHVGMSIKSYNLIYRQWINKENCFNLCLNTTLRNGFGFDCKSFEHWHSNCPSEQSTSEQHGKTCASFAQYESFVYHKNHRHHSNTSNSKLQRTSSRIDYCVLSNQTIESAGSLNFVENPAVTYYEILCTRPKFEIPKTTKIEIATKPTSQIIENPIFKATSTVPLALSTSPFIPIKTKTSKLTTTYDPHEDNSQEYDNEESKHTAPNETDDDSNAIKGCKFNPCLNDGACYLVKANRFNCLCKNLFYGDYCEYNAIEKICHKHFMELIISKEVEKLLQIELDDLFVNSRKTSNLCKLKHLNSTHVVFRIPFEKCLTSKMNMKYEKVFTNTLYYTKQTNKNQSKFVQTFDCRIDKDDSTTSKPTDTSLMNQVNNKPIKNSHACIINLLNLKLGLFQDESYRREINIKKGLKLARTSAEFNNQYFVQVSVEYSAELDELYQFRDKLQHFYLTIEKCWLTSSQNEFKNIVQVLIIDGCPTANVKFYDTVHNSKNSIRFSFQISNQFIRKKNLSEYYLHCFPEICTDFGSSGNENQLMKSERSFFSKFKACNNLSSDCLTSQSALINEENQDEFIINLKENKESILKNGYSTNKNECKHRLSKGPILIDNQDIRSHTRINKNSSSKLPYCEFHIWLFLIMLFFLF